MIFIDRCCNHTLEKNKEGGGEAFFKSLMEVISKISTIIQLLDFRMKLAGRGKPNKQKYKFKLKVNFNRKFNIY